ncbi:MAG: ABC transporter ATP-binding protein [Nitrospinae bacterium]|jgi:ATP-binding cassette, subfamily B, multidrug efflux pump|nr:ABC transporter ATP-binding protein [Nitrospinota bacterium]MDA1108738.1 ABC transporter ATP-binding protein [Nitrospinota bacterium]
MIPKKIQPFLPFMAKYRREMAIGMTALLMTDLAGLVIPWLLKEFVDLLPQDPSRSVLLKYAGLLFATSTFLAVGRYGWRKYLFGPSRKAEFDILNKLFAHFLTLDKFYFQRQKMGDLISRATNDLRSVRDFIGLGLLVLVDATVVIIACVSLMVWINPGLTMVVLLPLPLVSVLFFKFIKEISKRHQAVQEHLATMTARVQENLAGIRVLHAFAQEENEKIKFDALNREYIQKNLQITKLFGIFTPSLVFTLGVASMISLWLGAKAVIGEEMSLGSFVAFNGYLMMLSWPMMGIGYMINLTQKGQSAMGRIQEIFASQPAITEGTEDFFQMSGEIEFKNFGFSYPGSASAALTGIDLTIPKGQTLVIVGKIGSGKSTLAQMLPRILEGNVGSLCIDGQPIQKISLSHLRKNIGYVDQQPFLFSLSIRDNILLGNEEATQEEIDEAVRNAGLEADFDRFPEGLETIVGERGVSLSGGQKQRIALARALLKHPKLLVLDDAFSSLDAETEAFILKQIKQTIREVTTVIITHRLSIARQADQIILMDDGKIVERGTHSELLAKRGIYSTMFTNQALAQQMEITLQ